MSWTTNKSSPNGGVGDPYPTMPGAAFFQDDFTDASFSTTADAARYHLQKAADAGSGSATCVLSDGFAGGAALLTTDNAANDTASIMLNGESWQTGTSGVKIAFHARFKVEDADQDAFWIGLHENGTLTTGDVLAETTFDGIGFYANHASAGTATLKCAVGNGSSNNTYSTSVTMADNTFIEVGFIVFNRDKVVFAVKDSTGTWSTVYSATTYIPTNQLTAVFQGKTLDTGADDFTLDYWSVQADIVR